MTGIKLEQFMGEAPGIKPRRLPDFMATYARNARMDRSVLEPWRGTLKVLDSAVAAPKTIYRDDNQGWRVHDHIRHYVGTINANDPYMRIFASTPDYPVVRGAVGVGFSEFRLGLPRPSAPTFDASSNYGSLADPLLVENRFYKVTFVDAFGAEGPGSLPSSMIEVGPSASIVLNLPTLPSGDYNFSDGCAIRVYRSNSGTEATAFQYAGEVVKAGGSMPTTFTDTRHNDELDEVIITDDWIGPPNDDANIYPDGPLQQLTYLGDGVCAGFSGKYLYFSYPYAPHAWPATFRRGVKENIVGIAAVAAGLLVVTDGRPYLAFGADPSAITVQPLESNQACMSARGLVDMGEYAIYPSPDGLFGSTGNTPEILSQEWMNPNVWQTDFAPATIHAYQYEGMYVAFFDGTETGYNAFVFDPGAGQRSFQPLTLTAACGYFDSGNDRLYLAVADATSPSGWAIHLFDEGEPLPMVWRSKRFILPKAEAFSVMRVQGDTFPCKISVYVDGELFYRQTVRHSNPFRLPGGVRTKDWAFEISGTGSVEMLGTWTSMSEVE